MNSHNSSSTNTTRKLATQVILSPILEQGQSSIASSISFSSCYLAGRWTWRGCITRISSTIVGVLRRVHLDVGLSSAKVALSFSTTATAASAASIVPARILGLVVGGGCLLLRLVIGIVLRLPVTERRVTGPTCPVERLPTGATSLFGAKATVKRC